MLRAFMAMFNRDLLLAYRHRSELINPLLFFVIIISLFPLALGPESRVLSTIASGVVWVAALLAALLSLDTVFRSDFHDGALEQIVLSPQPLTMLVFAKVLAHWCVTGVPLILISPLLASMLHIKEAALGTLMLTLLLGTPVLSLVGSVGVALTVGLRRGGMLLSILVLPLYIPVLIFAAGAVNDAALGLDVSAQLAFLGSMLVLSITLTPLAIAAALRVSLN